MKRATKLGTMWGDEAGERNGKSTENRVTGGYKSNAERATTERVRNEIVRNGIQQISSAGWTDRAHTDFSRSSDLTTWWPVSS